MSHNVIFPPLFKEMYLVTGSNHCWPKKVVSGDISVLIYCTIYPKILEYSVKTYFNNIFWPTFMIIPNGFQVMTNSSSWMNLHSVLRLILIFYYFI